MQPYLLSLDQGTTSTRAIIFNLQGQPVGTSQRELKQHFPADGWVEHDALEIAESALAVCRDVLQKTGITAQQIAAIGITNQRETTVLWDRKSGQPLHKAIVWQDRRTADTCLRLKNRGFESTIQQKTGLLLDPYFSATKLAWLLDNVAGARARAEKGELAFGTIDTWLIWKLTGGRKHATDATNAARTLLFNIHTQEWDEELLRIFEIPASLLPAVQDSSSDFGDTETSLFGAPIPIGGVAGDQQAALIGQACFKPGMVKSTYGTGCFMVMNTGQEVIQSKHRLLTTVGYRLNGKVTYALEGSIFVAGAAVQWLRDGIQLIKQAGDTEAIAEETVDSRGVYLVPAFTGLGAPYWDPHARGAIFGLSRDTGIGEIVIAGLEAVCFQTRDLMEAMKKDGAGQLQAVRVDGGMAVNNWLMQALADIVGVRVDRPAVTETTALGVAWLAGLHVGKFASLDAIADLWHCQREFTPRMPMDKREKMYAGWLDAVQRVASKSV
ncbi:glycerol kinase [Fluviicoccus keumensis]|uniref:Glycerol kinase n=1 Tax=Fluviicoccus keumensis TaxID=1435465 RepID=A0A4Q7Z3P6_9GAMM|nr:glycerol kinase GlpK [Fluviicoccus keumensis]RZU44910.1 glycerol kinase [Fluviicoccus keumensis]